MKASPPAGLAVKPSRWPFTPSFTQRSPDRVPWRLIRYTKGLPWSKVKLCRQPVAMAKP